MIRRVLTTLALAAVLVGTFPVAAGADTSGDLREVKTKIDKLERRVRDAAAERSSLARRIKDTKRRSDELADRIAAIQAEIDRLDADLADRRGTLDSIRRSLQAQYRSLAEARSKAASAADDARTWARDAYMSAGAGAGTVAFSATAVNDVLVGVAYLDRLTRDRENAAERWLRTALEEARLQAVVASAEQEAATELAAIAGDEAELRSLLAELAQRREELAAELSSQQELLAEVEGEIARWEKEIAGLEREQASIERLILARSRPSKRTAGRYFRPVPGRADSFFGPRVHPIYGTVKMHNGLDMDGPMGQPIVAFASGRVIFAGVKGGYGNAVMIDHGGGMVTLYAHQSRLAVKVGQRVEGGQVIGYVGSTGLSTGPHLHFEVRIDGRPVDPMKYL